MINITKKAEKYLKKILSKKNNTNLRISIKFPGTEYSECKISYEINKNKCNEDIELKYDGFKIYIKKNIFPYLNDSKIDLFGDNLNKKLMLLAPNVKNNIYNNNIHNNNIENNMLFYKVQNFIDYNINPMLNMHGGKIILINITITGFAMIKFLGGCNGCSMSNITLKKNIEEKIINNFSEIKGVKDITEHHRGSHSFL